MDVVLDGLGARCRFAPSARGRRKAGRVRPLLTLANRRKRWRGWIEWYAATASVALWACSRPRRRYSPTGSRSCATATKCSPWAQAPSASVGDPTNPQGFREDFLTLLELLQADKIHPVVAERLPLSDLVALTRLLERSAAVGKLVLVP